ncbi:MAG: hypothetical protein WC307_03020 [Candidatus Nanoarchaeia archaeon]|jgi:hypothetical protein
MVEIVSLDDFLDSFDFSKKNYTPKYCYDAFNSLHNNTQSFVAKSYPLLSANAFSKWSAGSIPFFIRQVKSLEKDGLLPLSDYAVLFSHFKELFLHTLLSGSICKDKKSDTYTLSLSNTKDNLVITSEVIKDEFGIVANVNENKKPKDSSYLRISSNSDGLAQGLTRLLMLSGIPLGEKKDFDLCIPDFIDVESFIYYAVNLKSLNSYYKRDVVSGFNLWTSNKVTAQKNLDYVLDFLNKGSIQFKGYLYEASGNSKAGSFVPSIIVTKNHLPFFEMLLKVYKPLYGV